MSFNVQTGRISADISGNVVVNSSFPTASLSQTTINKSNTKSGTAVTAGTGINLYTVTGGKTFYLTSLIVKSNYASGTGLDIRDSASVAGTPIISCTSSSALGGAPVCITFPVPVKFTTGLWLDSADSSTVWWCISGYEA